MSTTCQVKNPSPKPTNERRGFLKLLLAPLAGAVLDNPLLAAILSDRSLLAQGAELAREALTVDLHCHASALAAKDFPGLDPEGWRQI